MQSTDKLVLMANQIARNLAVQGDERAVAATADHITRFWNARMRKDLVTALQSGDRAAELHPIVRRAIEHLETRARV